MTKPNQEKTAFRKRLRQARKDHSHRESTSRQIMERLQQQLEPLSAKLRTLAWYVESGSEVITREALAKQLKLASPDRRAAVPACVDGNLIFYRIESWEELASGAYGILEPDEQVRANSDRATSPEEFDVIIVPGVGFDESGNRLGQGKGYYDRFLSALPADTLKIGLAFDCQVVPKLPVDGHDVAMDWIVTETRSIQP